MKKLNLKKILSFLAILITVSTAHTAMAKSSKNMDIALFLKEKINFQEKKVFPLYPQNIKAIWTSISSANKKTFIARLVSNNQTENVFYALKDSKSLDSYNLLVKLAYYVKHDKIEQSKNTLKMMLKNDDLQYIALYGLTAIALEQNDTKLANMYSNNKKNHEMIDNLRIPLLLKQNKKKQANTIFEKLYPNLAIELADNTITYALKTSMPAMLSLLHKENLMIQMLAHYMDNNNIKITQLVIEGLLKQKRYDLAFQIVSKLDNARYGTYVKLSFAEANINSDAIHLSKKILDTLPNDYPGINVVRGQIASFNKDYKKSIKIYKSLDAQSIKRMGWNYDFTLGWLYERTGKISLAEKSLLIAVKKSNNNPNIVNHLAYMRINNGIKIKQSLEMLKEAYKDDPSSEIADSLGWAYYKDKQYLKAIQYIELSSTKLSTEAVINDHLGDAYAKSGRIREAIVHWKRVIELDKKNPDVNISLIKQKIKKYSKY